MASSHKLSSLLFFLLLGIEIAFAARVLTSASQEGYDYPNKPGVGGFGGSKGGGYSTKDYGNDYYWGWGTYGRKDTGSGYSNAPKYDSERGKGDEYDNGEQYGQGYGGGGGKYGGSTKEYDVKDGGSTKEYDAKDGGAYKYPNYEKGEKAGESSKEYFDYRYDGKSGEPFQEYNGKGSNNDKYEGTYNEYYDYESNDKGEKSYQKYSYDDGDHVYNP